MAFKKGHIGWNRGLTKETDERVKRNAENIKEALSKPETRLKMRNSHLGKKHTEDSKQKMRDVQKKGKESQNWKGGRFRKCGYIYVYSPSHPHCNSQKYVAENRLVLEKKLGRYLQPNEVAHHINEIKDDNRIENIKLMTHQEHNRHHMKRNEVWKKRIR